MSELWKQERHYGNLRHTRASFDDIIKRKEDVLFGLIGDEWRERLNGMTTLNVGCGPIPLRFGAKKELGIDPLMEQYISMNYPEKHKKGMVLIRGFANNIPLNDGHVDFVYCNNVIEYIGDWQISMDEMKRILKRGGHMALIYHSLQNDGTNLNLLHNIDMADRLRLMGFEILKHEVEDGEYTKIFARKL